MPRFRKKPVEIEARQWDGTAPGATDILGWILPRATATYRCGDRCCEGERAIVIPTLEGAMRAIAGDWIIRGIANEFYPCKPEIFEATYELVGD